LNPLNTVENIHAIVLAGGSAFGLEAATGVTQYLEEQGIGYETRVGKVPIVPAAILFDLNLGNAKIRPDRQAGYHACKTAKGDSYEEGNVGAGAGATVGKLFGFNRAMKSGIGTASTRIGNVTVGAIVVVNAVGDVVDPHNGQILAGARATNRKTLIDSMQQMQRGKLRPLQTFKQNTTLGVVATNVELSKTQTTKLAQMAHDGLARSINPVHTPYDGDVLFALSTGTSSISRESILPDPEVEFGGGGTMHELTLIGSIGADVVAKAVCRAVLAAKGLPGLPSCADLFG
jgi:L-aminopeptidase/D-esterase-like protein